MILHCINTKTSTIIHNHILDAVRKKNDNVNVHSINKSIDTAIDFYNNYIMENFDEIYNIEAFVIEMAGAVHDNWAEESIPVESESIDSKKLFRYLPYQFIGFDTLYKYVDFIRPLIEHMLDITELDVHALRNSYMDAQIKLQIVDRNLAYYDKDSVEQALTSGLYVSNSIMKTYLENPGLRAQIVECVVEAYDKDRSNL